MPLRIRSRSSGPALFFSNFFIVCPLSVPAALLDALRRKEEEEHRHRQIINQRRDGKAVVDELLKGRKQAEGAQDSTERFGEPCAAQQEQGAQPGTEGRKAEAAQREAPGTQAHRKGGSRRQSRKDHQCHGAPGVEHTAEAGHHIGQQQGRKAHDCRDDLVLREAGAELADGNGRTAQQEIAQQRGEICPEGRGRAAQQPEHDDHDAVGQTGQREHGAEGQILAHHDAPHGHRAGEKELVGAGAALFGQRAHGQHREIEQQHEDRAVERIVAKIRQAVTEVQGQEIDAGSRQQKGREHIAHHAVKKAAQLPLVDGKHRISPPFYPKSLPEPSAQGRALPNRALRRQGPRRRPDAPATG